MKFRANEYGKKNCCASGAVKITMVNVGGIKVGLIAVDEIFKKLSESSMTLTQGIYCLSV